MKLLVMKSFEASLVMILFISQHQQEVRVKMKFSLIDDETPKMEDCLR